MDERILLEIVGITYNQIESGLYALLLREEGGQRRLPIIIGAPEAQSIECALQQIKTPRPLTHDFMAAALRECSITVSEVMIYRLPSGMFAADVIFEDRYGAIHTVDARSSDAVALAIRTGAPIFTSRSLMDEIGVTQDNQSPLRPKPAEKSLKKSNFSTSVSVTPGMVSSHPAARAEYKDMSLSDLRLALDKAVQEEAYEKASIIQKEINKRNQSNEK